MGLKNYYTFFIVVCVVFFRQSTAVRAALARSLLFSDRDDAMPVFLYSVPD